MKVYSIQLRTGSIVSSNYVVLHLLKVKIHRSGRSKLPPWGKIGTIAVQSLLLHIIFAQIWYETGQWRKVIRFPCTSWWCGGYLNTSWRSVLEFELRLLRLPVMVLNDTDIQLLHGKGIKRRLLVYPCDWNGRGMCLVLVWEIIEVNRCENPFIFLQISVAIDLHEGSRFIAQGIFTNSISLAQSHLRICIQWCSMDSSCDRLA